MGEEKERKKAKEFAGPGGGTDHVGGQTRDPHSERLLSMMRSVGNDAMREKLGQGNVSRDEMLAFVCHRLRTIREVQVREQDLTSTDAMNRWWRVVGDRNKTEYTEPNPHQWALPAELYQQAAEQLAQGNLARGAELLKRANKAENTAFANLTALVDKSELDTRTGMVAAPAAVENVEAGQGCGACKLPEEISLAHRIVAASDEVKRAPNRKRIRDPWWTEEEEEEEESQEGEA